MQQGCKYNQNSFSQHHPQLLALVQSIFMLFFTFTFTIHKAKPTVGVLKPTVRELGQFSCHVLANFTSITQKNPFQNFTYKLMCATPTAVPVISITNYEPKYYAEFKELMQLCYNDMGEACSTEAEIQLLSELYPKGQILIFVNGVLGGATTSRIVPYTTYFQAHTQADIEDMNRYRNDAQHGESVYALDIFVHPQYRHSNLSLAKVLVKMIVQQVSNDGFKHYFGISRVPNFSEFANTMDLETYAQKVVNRELKDSVLGFHLSCGAKIVNHFPHYNPADLPSMGCGVLVEYPLVGVAN